MKIVMQCLPSRVSRGQAGDVSASRIQPRRLGSRFLRQPTEVGSILEDGLLGEARRDLLRATARRLCRFASEIFCQKHEVRKVRNGDPEQAFYPGEPKAGLADSQVHCESHDGPGRRLRLLRLQRLHPRLCLRRGVTTAFMIPVSDENADPCLIKPMCSS